MVAERAPITRVGRRGRQPALVENLRDTRDDLTALRAEAIAFVDGAMPLASRLAYAASFLDTETHQAGRTLIDRLDHYRARHR